MYRPFRPALIILSASAMLLASVLASVHTHRYEPACPSQLHRAGHALFAAHGTPCGCHSRNLPAVPEPRPDNSDPAPTPAHNDCPLCHYMAQSGWIGLPTLGFQCNPFFGNVVLPNGVILKLDAQRIYLGRAPPVDYC